MEPTRLLQSLMVRRQKRFNSTCFSILRIPILNAINTHGHAYSLLDLGITNIVTADERTEPFPASGQTRLDSLCVHVFEVNADDTRDVLRKRQRVDCLFELQMLPFGALSPRSEVALSVLVLFSNARGPTPFLPGARTLLPGSTVSYGSRGVQSHV